MSDHNKHRRYWLDIGLKALTPVLAGLLIAWAGFVGDRMLSSIASKQESARLITELQIKREQAESALRKDVFNQALNAFFLNRSQKTTGTLSDMSKQLLQLELLALNFGDSLSLSPLFTELRNDLDRSRPVNDEERRDYKERKGELRKRLDNLARRVASAQVSSLAQHGKIIKADIPLYGYGKLVEEDIAPCKKSLFEDRDFAWPAFEILAQIAGLGIEYNPNLDYAGFIKASESVTVPEGPVLKRGLIELNGIKRHLKLNVSNVNHCKKTAKIQIRIFRDDPNNPEVNRTFTLDYFNFPMVDNTRLSANQRFAIVMEEFNLKGKNPHIEITGVVFPSEYASLRDRPGMQEARMLLESALGNGDGNDD